MKIIFKIFIMVFAVACGSNTVELEDCLVKNTDNAIFVEDTLGVYGFYVPDSSWEIHKGSMENWHLLALKYEGENYMAFNVGMAEYSHDWNWDIEQLEIDNNFNVIETGDIVLDGNTYRYNYVKSDRGEYHNVELAYYITLLDTVKSRNFTITMMTNSAVGYDDRFCELFSLLRSFEPGVLTKKEAFFYRSTIR